MRSHLPFSARKSAICDPPEAGIREALSGAGLDVTDLSGTPAGFLMGVAIATGTIS